MDINTVTTGTIDGTGNFDKIMQVVGLHLREELRAQRITSDKYAEVYMSVMNQALAQSIQFTLSEATVNPQSDLINQQIKSEKAKIVDVIDGAQVVGSIGGQKAVYVAQVKAFKDKSYQAAAELLAQTWTVQRSSDSGIAPNIDNGLFDNNVGAAVDALFKQVGIKSNPISDVGSMNARLDGETIVATGTIGIDGDVNSLKVIASHSGGNITLVNTYIDASKNFTVIDSEAFATLPKGEFSVITSFSVHGQLRTLRTRLTKP